MLPKAWKGLERLYTSMEKNKSKLTLEAEIYFDVVKMGRDKRRWDRRVKCDMKYKWKRDPI